MSSSPCLMLITLIFIFFFFNDTATTEIYTLSLHDALPISGGRRLLHLAEIFAHLIEGGADRFDPFHGVAAVGSAFDKMGDRKSTRLNSSHSQISYAVFCLKKKKQQHITQPPCDSATPPSAS